MRRPGLSVKLSAIHPRYEPSKAADLYDELLPSLVDLAASARAKGLGLTIDAEEQSRLDLSLGLFERLIEDPAVAGWPGLGLAVQTQETQFGHLGRRHVGGHGDHAIAALQRLDDNGYSGHLSYILHMLDAPRFLATYQAGDFKPEEVMAFGQSHQIVINRMVAGPDADASD